MLIIPVKEGESIDKALKKFKKKFERTQTMRQLRKRQAFSGPSKRNDPRCIQAYSTSSRRLGPTDPSPKGEKTIKAFSPFIF